MSGPGSPGTSKDFPSTPVETTERFGHSFRHFPVSVSTEAMALAWANTQDGPDGGVVVVDLEIGARGHRGRVWTASGADSLACSVILRPKLAAEQGDTCWLVASLAACEGAEEVTGRTLATWWPDAIVEASSREEVSAVRAEIQLGPGKVKSAVVTMRFDLPRLGLSGDDRDTLLEAVVGAVDRASERLDQGPETLAAAYTERCPIVGQRVKLKLRPKGETRGTVRAVDRLARLELASATGMVERIGVDQMADLTLV